MQKKVAVSLCVFRAPLQPGLDSQLSGSFGQQQQQQQQLL
jgi:hypothetical protein